MACVPPAQTQSSPPPVSRAAAPLQGMEQQAEILGAITTYKARCGFAFPSGFALPGTEG